MPHVDYLNIDRAEPLLSPFQIHRQLPISTGQQKFVEESRHTIQQILEGKDSRLLLIVGPCSIHDITAAKEFATKLRTLAYSLSDRFFIAMRVYFEKPRTSQGWKGILYDPRLDGSHDIATGIQWTRQLLLDLAEMGIATGAELLDPFSAHYFGDLLAWGCIGARTAASPTHRQMASGLPMPIAFKNSTDGNIETAVNGILCAVEPHSYIGMNMKGQLSAVETTGNSHGHIVLRGGRKQPNYDPESIAHALDLLKKVNLAQRLLVDCSHDNSVRNHENQIPVFKSVVHQVIEGNRSIRGMLIESNIHAGNQPFSTKPSERKYAVSLTDPCLSWASTEQLLQWGYATLKHHSSTVSSYTTVKVGEVECLNP